MVRTPGLEPGSLAYKARALTLELRPLLEQAQVPRSDHVGLRYQEEIANRGHSKNGISAGIKNQVRDVT